MSRKAKKYSIVLLTVCLSAAVFAMTAFAKIKPQSSSSPGLSGFRAVALTENQTAGNGGQTGDNGTGNNTGDNGTGDNGTGDNGTGDNGTGGNGSQASDNTGSSSSSKAETEMIDVTLDYNDGSAPKVISVASGTKVSSLSVPERKGYDFDCWTMNGVEVSPSLEIYTEISLTARWTVSTTSSRAPSSYASVDTHAREVEQAASRAAEAISDPDVLSSEDWGSLLSAASGTEAAGAGTPSSAASPPTSQGGGSWLFPVGIGLIVLSACGIGAFVYLQFFSGAGPRIPPGPSEGGEFRDMEFTDISSHSDGPYSAPEEPQAPAPPDPGSEDDTRPVPPQIRSAPASDRNGAPKAEALPVDGRKSDFDWDKFFSDDI